MNDWCATCKNKKQVLCIYWYSLGRLSKHGIKFSNKAIFLTSSHLIFCEWTFYVIHISKCGISSAFQISDQISDILYGFPSKCTRTSLPLQATLRERRLLSHRYASLIAIQYTYCAPHTIPYRPLITHPPPYHPVPSYANFTVKICNDNLTVINH